MMELALSIVILNLKPEYAVSVPLIASCRRLWKTWSRYVKPSHPTVVKMYVENGVFETWFDDGQLNRWMRVDSVPIHGIKFWCNMGYAMSYRTIIGVDYDYYDVRLTEIVIRGRRITIHEGRRPSVIVVAKSGRAVLRADAPEWQKRKFVEVAQCLCSALGMTAQEILEAASEIVG